MHIKTCRDMCSESYVTRASKSILKGKQAAKNPTGFESPKSFLPEKGQSGQRTRNQKKASEHREKKSHALKNGQKGSEFAYDLSSFGFQRAGGSWTATIPGSWPFMHVQMGLYLKYFLFCYSSHPAPFFPETICHFYNKNFCFPQWLILSFP